MAQLVWRWSCQRWQTAGGGSNPCWSARESQVRPAERQRAPTTKKVSVLFDAYGTSYFRFFTMWIWQWELTLTLYSSTELTACQSIKSLCQWHSFSHKVLLRFCLWHFSRFKTSTYRLSPPHIDMGRNSRSWSTRRTHRETGRRRSSRQSPRERSPRRKNRDDSRHRSELKRSQTDRLEIPSSWNSSDTHWDTKTEYGLNLPKRVESTQFSRRQNLAGQEISQIKLIDVVQSGISNWGLRLVANGRFVSCEFFRNRLEATFATTLFSRNVKAEGHLGLPSTVGSFHTTGSRSARMGHEVDKYQGIGPVNIRSFSHSLSSRFTASHTRRTRETQGWECCIESIPSSR